MVLSEVVDVSDDEKAENREQYHAPIMVELGSLGTLVNGTGSGPWDHSTNCTTPGEDPDDPIVCD